MIQNRYGETKITTITIIAIIIIIIDKAETTIRIEEVELSIINGMIEITTTEVVKIIMVIVEAIEIIITRIVITIETMMNLKWITIKNNKEK